MVRFGLDGRVLFITGAGSGIGRATACRAAQDGALVALVDANLPAATETLGMVSELGGQGRAFALDVRDAALTRSVVEEVERSVGPIHGVVTCAGITKPSYASDMDNEAWDDVIGVNLTGTFLTARACSGPMISRRSGSIVVVSSILGLGGHTGRVNYAATKHGVIGVARTLAIEWGRFGIRVNALAPGIIATPLVSRNTHAQYVEEVFVDRTPLGRLGTADEQAMAALFLLSDAASFVTGATLTADGGMSAGALTHHQGADGGFG